MLWVLAVALVFVGLVGTILPALPGPILVFAGLLTAAWADSFTRIGFATLSLLAVMTAAAHLVDVLCTALGVRQAGASRRAVAGAAVGAAAGLLYGLPGLLIGPLVGAVIGELTVRGDMRGASRAGLAAWLGLAVGTALKVALVVAMVGIGAAAFFF